MHTSDPGQSSKRLFYEKDGTSVGPFDLGSLSQLQAAGIINGETRIRFEDQSEWQRLGSVAEVANEVPSKAFYYLNSENQPTGPFSQAELTRLITSGIIFGSTLVTTAEEEEWREADEYLPLPPKPPSDAYAFLKARNIYLEALFTFLTLGLYWCFYRVPKYTQDMEIITGKPRIKFVHACLLGVFTLGIFSTILSVIYAVELGHLGKERGTPGRLSMFGLQILGGNIFAFKIAFLSGGLALIMSGVIYAILVSLFQRELNLYATRSPIAVD